MSSRAGSSSGGSRVGGSRRTYSARARRGGARDRSNGSRFVSGRVVLAILLVVSGMKLIHVQTFEAGALSAEAERQRTTPIDIPAERGSLVDRNGAELAFNLETRTLWANLRQMRQEQDEREHENPEAGEDYSSRVAEIAGFIADELPEKTSKDDLLERFHQDASFTYLVDDVEPSVAEDIKDTYPEIGHEKRSKRVYPMGESISNIIGFANWRQEDPDVSQHNIHGLSGLESARDDDLVGTPGRQIVDTARGTDVVIPGTERDVDPAVPGSDLELTIDSDVQYEVQRLLADYVDESEAQAGSAVVLDAQTGEVVALTDDETFDPDEPDTFNPDSMNNRAVTTPFEPGSVHKVVTATALMDADLADPDSVYEVPGSIDIADHSVHDAWSHGTQEFTVRGIFAKSSNVGTLMLADEVGEDRYLDMLHRFGVGERTGIGLPGESPGRVPPREEWSGTTFGNLPIGQGLSVTALQMTSMFQAVANDGERVEPRLVRAKITPDGERIPESEPETTRVTSAEDANTIKDMLRAVTQDGDTAHRGTAPEAALEGYQISGKTGTGQQIDPETGAYSNDLHNVAFAGILPADDPRFVVGIHLDAPDTTLPEGNSAAPLFHDIAAYLAQHHRIPMSEAPAPDVPLIHKE